MANKKTSIGGQALIEGIMMKGPYKTVMAVRKKDGGIDVSEVEEKHIKDKYKIFGWPLIRGMVNLIESMIIGYKAMMKSADISGFTDLEDEPERATVEAKTETDAAAETVEASEEAETVPAEEQAEAKAELNTAEETADKKDEKKKKSEEMLMGGAMVLGTVLGVALAVVLFMYLPSLAFKGINYLSPVDLKYYRGLIEGVIKIILFVGYIAVVALEKDIKRVFMYHGAEHKTIFCYEKGLELNVENVRKQTRFHPRCGTSFMFLMIAVGILISTVLTMVLPEFIVSRLYIWVPLKILILPLTCGLGYELIKICGRHDNIVTKIIAAPGLWVQRLTTKEPDDDMIEIAIASVLEVIPLDGADEIK